MKVGIALLVFQAIVICIIAYIFIVFYIVALTPELPYVPGSGA